ncbi:MAG: hypothetical protein PHV05_12670 [Candidatus Riflebacteria bacterium]|nr:hypothetical protein [Candidatus Riflebacteria bacterium]
MTCFEDLFIKSKGQPIDYNGKTIQMFDRVSITDKQQIRIVFESTNSEWKQGIHLSTDGSFEVNGQTVQKAIVLWKDTAPSDLLVRVKSKKGECFVKNVWDVGDGVMHSWHNGAAMIVEELKFGRRYKCNDGRADENFDDLIFRIEVGGLMG